MKKTVLMTTATVLALCTGGLASAAQLPAASSAGKGAVAHRLIMKNNLSVLYTQNNNDEGVAVNSQMYESKYSAYDDQGADDFTVPANTKWLVKEVDVTGVYYKGSQPATSENVYFYADSKGLPGKLVASYSNVVGTDNGSGSFVIPVPKTVLKGGTSGKTYWVSVQANCSITGGCGEWKWELTNVQNGDLSAWQNPGGGFGVCPSWGTTQSCQGAGPDFMFTLKGKAK